MFRNSKKTKSRINGI